MKKNIYGFEELGAGYIYIYIFSLHSITITTTLYLQKESEKKEKTYNADVKRKSNLRFQNFYIRLCLVPVKYFLENIYFPEMLFSGKKNVFKLFGCLKIHLTENQL